MVKHEQYFIDPVIDLCLYNLVYKLEEEIPMKSCKMPEEIR